MFQRVTCVICNFSLKGQLSVIKRVPLFMGAASFDDFDDILLDQTWVTCERCFCTQLECLIPLDILYKSSHGAGTVGTSWGEHHQAFAEFCRTHSVMKVVLEPGAGNCNLAKNLATGNTVDRYDICDPSLPDDEHEKIKIISSLLSDFDENGTLYDTVIMSHTFEHLYTPRQDLKKLYNLLKDGGKLLLSVPLIDTFLENGWTNGLNFEHTYMLTKEHLTYILREEGFDIESTYNFSPNNLFLSCVKQKPVSQSILEFHSKKGFFNEYFSILAHDIDDLNLYLAADYSNYRVFLYGAHVFSQTLLQFGLNSENILAVLDNDKKKWNSRLYGTSFMIKSPEVLKNIENPVVILRAAQYTPEIANTLLTINPTTIII